MSTLIAVASLQAQSSGQNYVTTVTYLDSLRSDSTVQILYCDGLGRPIQSVSQSANGKFLFTHQQYDQEGRDSVAWAPVVGLSTAFRPLSQIGTLSTACYGGDTRCYSQTTYDVLGHPVFVSTPGDAWTGKGKSLAYRSNTAQEVKHYTPSDMSGAVCYAIGALACTETTDEDGHKVQEFHDLAGNIVLQRQFCGTTTSDTYYVYDAKGRLARVLQPMFQQEPDTGKFAFRYEYDVRGRMVTKKLPGCAPVHYWYDSADHVVRMQDGVLAANSSFRTYEYDALGRLTRQSILEQAGNGGWSESDEVLNYYDTYGFLSEYASMTPYNEVDDMDLGPLNAAHGIGQLTGTWQVAGNGEQILTTFSYDGQGRLVMQKEVGLGKVLTVTSLGYDFTGDVTNESYAVYPYDTSTQSYRTGPWQGIITHNYNHPHTKLPTSSVLQLTDGTNTMTDTIANCSYNDFAHLTADNRSGTSADMSYTFDNLHGWLTGITGCNGRYAQRLYYGSDGSLPCYNGSIAAMTWRTGDDYVRRYDYGYDGLNHMTSADYSYYSIGSPASYEPTLSLMPGIGGDYEDYSVEYGYDRNGNITSVYRQGRLSFGDDDDGYDTVEDDYVVRDGNRLKAYETSPVGTPYFGSMDFHDGASMEVEYLYDANGSLIRDENRGVTYQYDLLGHLTSATTDKGPDNKYRRTEYVYAADGRCLRKVQRLYWNPSSTINQCLSTAETAYCGPFIMSNGTVVSFRFEGGYCSMGDGVPMACHFYLKDYQGSNRMVVNAATDAVEQVTHYYPYGGLMADISTGQGLQPYKYGGKELDRFGGLDLYDFGARQMDPLLPSFTSVDPMAEEYYAMSPYTYCEGNPANMIDPDGRNPIYSSNGVLIGTTKEGYTGQIYVYTGSYLIHFEDMTIEELLSMNIPDLMPYEAFARLYSKYGLAGFVSNVMTDIMEQYDGTDVFGTTFDMSTLYNGRVGYREYKNSSFITKLTNGQIHILANRPISPDYEATVENLASSLIVHEWYGHGIMRNGSHHIDSSGNLHPNHHLVYKKVLDYTPLSYKTTFRYLLFLNNRFNHYLMKEGF